MLSIIETFISRSLLYLCLIMAEKSATLGLEENTGYLEKLQLIGGEDPYGLDAQLFSDIPELLPAISYPDIVNYLIFTPSPYTVKDLKAYKGMEAYNQFVCGSVREVRSRVYYDRCNRCLVKAKVLHSQRLGEKPSEPWIIAESEGNILAAHCTCMAGLEETCTHVASLLFAIDATVRVRDSKTFSQEVAYWHLPNPVKNIEYKEIRHIDFTSAKTKKKELDAAISSCSIDPSSANCPSTSNGSRSSTSTWSSRSSIPLGTVPPPVPTEDEISKFFKELNACSPRSAILSLTAPYSDNFK